MTSPIKPPVQIPTLPRLLEDDERIDIAIIDTAIRARPMRRAQRQMQALMKDEEHVRALATVIRVMLRSDR